MKERKWYKRQNSAGLYYTVYPDPVQRFIAPGTGTPKEIAAALEENPDAWVSRGNVLMTTDWDSHKSDAVDLPAQAYRFEPGTRSDPPRLIPKTLRNDYYIGLSELYEPISKEIRLFLRAESLYAKKQIPYRYSLLMVGPPGNGKTALIREVLYREIPEDSFAIFMPQLPPETFIEAINQIDSKRLKVCIFEEMAASLQHTPLEPLLDFLDGETSMTNTINIGTTNYPELLPPALLSRTGRFDMLYYVDNPGAKDRKRFLEEFSGEKISEEDIEDTRGLSISDLKEVVMVAERRGVKVSDAIGAVKVRHRLVKDILEKAKR